MPKEKYSVKNSRKIQEKITERHYFVLEFNLTSEIANVGG